MAFGKKKQEANEISYETRDLLIVFDDDNLTSDINQITSINEGEITVDGLYKLPVADCEITTGREGRNFFYRAPQQSIQEVERLANLERNMVLRQITAYEPPVLPTAFDWTKGLLFGLLVIAFIIIAVVAS